MIEDEGPLTPDEKTTILAIMEDIRPRIVELIKGARTLILDGNYAPAYALIVASLEETIKFHVYRWALGAPVSWKAKRRFITQIDSKDHRAKQRAAVFQSKSQFKRIMEEDWDIEGREELVAAILDTIGDNEADQLEWRRQHALYVGSDWTNRRATCFQPNKRETVRLFEIAREYAHYHLTVRIVGSPAPYDFEETADQDALRTPLLST